MAPSSWEHMLLLLLGKKTLGAVGDIHLHLEKLSKTWLKGFPK